MMYKSVHLYKPIGVVSRLVATCVRLQVSISGPAVDLGTLMIRDILSCRLQTPGKIPVGTASDSPAGVALDDVAACGHTDSRAGGKAPCDG